MMNDQRRSIVMALAVTAVLAGCSGGSGGGSANPFSSSPTPPFYVSDYSVTGVDPTSLFTFDISWMDSANGRYYLADRTTKGVDVYDTHKNQFLGTITGGFTGAVLNTAGTAVNNAKSGPNGVTVIPSTTLVYAGDVNKVIVVDGAAMTVVTSVAVNGPASLGGTGLRADEACYDPVHKRYLIATPDVDNSVVGQTAFVTVLDATNPAAPVVTGFITFFDPTDLTGATPGTASAGLEQCAYDAVNDQFLINNDGTVANPQGEVDAFGAADVAALAGGAVKNVTALTGYKAFGIGGTTVKCNPRGLDLGPGTTKATAEFAINCSNSVGSPMVTQIMNRSAGTILATAAVGGGDQLTYDPATNRYYVTATNWNPSGVRAAATTPVTPVLGVVDATTGNVVATLAAGQGSHSVTVDPVTHQAFLPHTVATAAVCPSCSGQPWGNSGVSIYRVQ